MGSFGSMDLGVGNRLYHNKNHSNMIKVMKRLLIIIYLMATAFGCANTAGMQTPPMDDERNEQNIFIRRELAKEGRHIDYDTLVAVYNQMRTARDPIPHMDLLLSELIRQRNENPRIDKMVIIYAANVIGKSKYPIKDVQVLFEMILQDENRINDWVLIYVGAAIGDYMEVLPDGDQLVDRIEAHQTRLEAEKSDDKEYFGVHFLPPPKTQRIKSYIAGIKDRELRESERRAYYILIDNHIPEERVVLALNYLQGQQHLRSPRASTRPMKYMVLHWPSLQKALKGSDEQP